MNNNNGFQNPLSWSISRSTLLYYCQKKYFFNYYGNFLKEFDESFWLEHLLLKNLRSIDMRLGEKAHNLISDYLNLVAKKQDTVENINKLKEKNLEEMDWDYNFSKTRSYEQYDKNNKFGLSEHYYKQDIDTYFEKGKEKIITQFNNFLSHQIHNEIKVFLDGNSKYYIEPKEPDFERMKVYPDDMPELLGTIIWAQPDFGIITDDNKYYIYDWKTGKLPEYDENNISNQLKVYAYKLLLNLGAQNTDEIEIYAYEVFLSEMKIYGGKINNSDIEDIKNKIVEDIENERKLIVDGNIENNRPLPTHYFARTDNINKCERCTFRKICCDLKNYEAPEINVFKNDKTKTEELILDDDFPF